MLDINSEKISVSLIGSNSPKVSQLFWYEFSEK